MKKYLPVVLSSLSLLYAQSHWQTAVFADDIWKYVVPDTELNGIWNTIEFDDSNWLEGQGGFGYGDSDDGTLLDQAISVYFRKSFNISDLTKLSKAIINADYDDGFVAFLNGYEIGRSDNLSEFGTVVPFDATTEYDHEASLYSGGYPEEIIIDSIELSDILSDGENVFSVQVHNVGASSSDMSANFFLTFGITDSSIIYSDPPQWFREPISFNISNLPLLLIDTYGNEIPDEPRIDAYMGIINNSSGVNHVEDVYNGYDGHITIERRGNSSQWNDKRPYRFETVDENGENNNVSLLGMPEENDWVLYAPWQDKSMIRNILAYQLSNDIGRYAPKTKFIELYLNGNYEGVYVLMEKIKRDNNRVDISKLNSDEISGDDVTGGYILKFDWYYTGDQIGGFQSNIDGMVYNYHYPKPGDIVPEQENYIIEYIDNFENIMTMDNYADPISGYPSTMNVESFVDFILLQEMAKNVDAYRLSTYIYKDKESIDDRLTAGPIWDFNHGYGNCDYGQTWEVENWLLEYNPEGGDQMSFWWELLWQDENFQAKVSERYTELRSNVFSEDHINGIIDSLVYVLGDAVERNFTKWPILGTYVWPNYFIFDTFEQEVEYLKSWTSDRLGWMDSRIYQLKAENELNPNEVIVSKVYPNPFNPFTLIQYHLPKDAQVNMIIFDSMGRKVKTLLNDRQLSGYNSIMWDATDDKNEPVSTGSYVLIIKAGKIKNSKKMIFLK